jgi:trimeric autotransporter adhesin
LNERVQALALYEGDLIAGGDFTAAGATTLNGVGRWDGATWQPLGAGMSGGGLPGVRALAIYGGDLIAGGMFTVAGDEPVGYIARWDGAAWQPLGSGVNGWVHGFGTFEGDLVVVGEFTEAGGQPANFIARWNGTDWSPCETGLDNWGLTLAPYANDLFVGGWFMAAGGRPSFYIARWTGASTADAPEPDRDAAAGLALRAPSLVRGETTFAFVLEAPGVARLSIHDVTGRRVATPLQELLPRGAHLAVWNGRDDAGAPAAAGAYFARLEAGTRVSTRKLLLLR